MNISQQPTNMSRQRGFTLVEIAIVLVIIGLLLGGVLGGQQLIASAKVKAQIQQIDEFSAIVNTYQDKYGALPGDDANATTNTGIATLTNGSGNGVFSANEGDQLIWEHLQAAGLLQGYIAAANGRFINKFGQETYARSNAAGLPGLVICAAVPNDVAREIDRKMDNNDGTTGTVRRNNQTAYPTVAGNSWICSSAS